MSNETKKDVLKNALNFFVATGLVRNINYGLERYQYLSEYDAALPDDLPVIPKAVGDAIKIHKDYAQSLLDIFGALSIYGVSRTEPSLDYNAWIVHHPDTFARAWVLGAWYVEETGEIVKLEAED